MSSFETCSCPASVYAYVNDGSTYRGSEGRLVSIENNMATMDVFSIYNLVLKERVAGIWTARLKTRTAVSHSQALKLSNP